MVVVTMVTWRWVLQSKRNLLGMKVGKGMQTLHGQLTKWLLQEKLRLDMSDEDAVEWMQQLLNDSATALMPQITDRTHRWATYWLR